MLLVLILLVGLGLFFIVRVRQRLALLAEQVRQLRAAALEPIAYTLAPGGTLDDALATVTAEVDRLGFTVIGDVVEHSSINEAANQTLRWIVDAEGTTFGWLAPFEVEGQRHIVAVLMSHELDQQTITARQPAASTLARPPFVDLQAVPIGMSFTDTFAKHRKRAQLDDSERAFVPARTFDQLAAELDRMRGKTIEWRKNQPADDLLEADLKTLLGAQHAKLAGPLRRRLVS